MNLLLDSQLKFMKSFNLNVTLKNNIKTIQYKIIVISELSCDSSDSNRKKNRVQNIEIQNKTKNVGRNWNK